MNEFLASAVATLPLLALGAAALLWWRRRVRRRQHQLREAGYRLIHELKAYSAWIELLRGEPFPNEEPEQLTAAQALRNARTITQAAFPELTQPMLRLLSADTRLMAHLWQQKVLRLSEPGAWVPHERDSAYWQIRDAQEDLIEEVIARCRVLMGEAGRPWHSTDLNSEFFETMGLSTRPT